MWPLLGSGHLEPGDGVGGTSMVLLPLLNEEEEDVWVGEGREEGREGGRQTQLQRTKSNGRELRQGEFFFKVTRNERKQEAPRGLWIRELKFKMEI